MSWPGPRARAAPSTSGPTQSAASGTGRPMSSARRAAAGASEYVGSRWPLGRPRCEARTTDAPTSRQCRTVGSAAVIRVSSVIRPPSRGTLKSTRKKTRRPPRSTCATLAFATAEPDLQIALERPGHVADQVTHATGIPPLVVVPGEHLDEIAIDDGRRRQVDDRRVRVTVEVHRHQLLVGRVEDSLEGTRGRGRAERVIDRGGGRGLV